MMDDAGGVKSKKNSMRDQEEAMSDESEEETWDSEDEDDTIARIQRAHYAQAAAMNKRRRAPARPRAMSQKRKMEAVKNFAEFTKKLKKDTGITIRGLVGRNMLELDDFSSEESSEQSDSDGLSEEEFVVNPNAVEELSKLDEENESFIDPETGDIVERKKSVPKAADPAPPEPEPEPVDIEPEIETEAEPEVQEEPKTLSISDIINEGDLDLTKNVEIAEVEGSELCPDKTAEELLGMKQEESSQDQDYDITDKFKDMDGISVKPIKKEGEEGESVSEEKKADGDDEKKTNTNALNVRRNIREVMDEKQLDASTLAAQRQESERLARVQEQQRIIREVQRQIALNRQNKVHQKTLQLLQGGSSILKKGIPGNKLNLPNTVLVKLPSGETKKTTVKQGQVEVTRIPKPSTAGPSLGHKAVKPEQKSEKKDVVEIVSSSSGEESSSSSSDSDDCIMLSDSEVPPSPEADEDPNNSGLHVNDTYNVPDEQGRVLINLGHPESEEDIFLAPQIARIIKPHQIGGVRFLFDNIIESVERFSSSSGFGCILAHSMGLGKTLQIVCFTDIFLRHTSSKTVLCIMPINTLQNWVAEFNKWLPLDPTNNHLAAQGEVRARNFPIYVLNDSHKTLQMRAKVVKDWTTTGGVLMIGYELYRLLSMKKDKKPRKKRKADAKAESEKEKEDKDKKTDKPELGNDDTTQGSDITNQSKLSEDTKDKEEADTSKTEDVKDDSKKDDKKDDEPTSEDKKLLDEMYEALVKPGPDLVICDEGHRIKNSHSNISYALKQMRTKRRVVLTGYPLQNNLLEYWCMVDFVRPNYLGSKTEFCNMFERPIQNGQCIDSTPQDIRLMRYRAHVLHSLLVGFVQRRSHAVLQSTLPQKEEFVLLIRMTPLQRKLYDRFMNEVVRSTSVPNPLKAFAICCKIWNHPDVLYNFLRKRSEANAAIEEDLDLEELGGVTKAGRATRSKAPPRRAAKPRGGKGASKKPAATIPPNQTSTGPPKHPGDTNSFGNYGPNGPPYGAPVPYGPNQEGSYPPYQNYPNSGQGYYPPNQGYNQNYGNNYYQQQPYGNNYPNQYPQNSQDPNYNQNYWGNGNGNNYYGNNGSGYYNNPQYPNNQPPQNYPGGQPPPDYRANQTPQNYTGTQPPDYNNPQPYPPNYTAPPTDPSYTGNMVQPYQNNQEGYANQPQPPYAQGSYPNQQGYPGYNATPGVSTPVPGPSPTYPTQPAPSYPNQTYPPTYPGNSSTYPNAPGPYNPQYGPNNYPGYPDNAAPNEVPINNIPGDQVAIKDEPAVNYPANGPIKTEGAMPPNNPDPNYDSTGYNYNQPIASGYPNQIDPSTNTNYAAPYDGYPSHLETKPPLGSSGSPITAWPIIKTEVDRLKAEVKNEVKSESDGEVKIEDLDTKKLVKEGSKKEVKPENPKETHLETADNKHKKDDKEKKAGEAKSGSESEEEVPKKGKQKAKGKETRPEGRRKPGPKPKGKPGPKPRGRKDRKTSKDKNDDSDSEDSDKEEKLNREEELALVKKAEEMTYDWAAELLKDYIPGIIENSAKMELFFYILNESIKLGDRILLFSQSLFTLNLIEDFLQRNYIPGTNCVWQKNTNYYRLDGSTHALEREKLINEFNANPHVYLFLVSTRAGSLGINLVGANRVIVFDASWNPCHDTQAVCRVYRYGQKKPCFVYRFVMDWCLEKKIYDRQINKQGMADRVVDECNPDAVLSMKEITNLCFDNDEKETEVKDLSEHKDKYIDVIMQGIITQLGQQLSKEPFQHESLLVDRKEKKLSSAEKRLAQRGYELEKKAAAAPKPTTAYRTVRTADGSIVQRPVASVRPMQHGARWIPADVWRRQGMTAQEMTLPLDVVIPTNSAEKTNIVLKAGQRVMVLKSPKGIYMQLESGKIIAIKTSLKGLAGKSGDNKDGVGKKIMGPRPSTANIPGSLKNNSAITITSKTGLRPGLQRIMNRPSMMGQNKIIRPLITGQRPRLPGTDMKAYNARRLAIPQGRSIRPNLPGSLSITKISKKPDNENSDSNNASKIDAESEEDTQVLDSDDEEGKEKAEKIRRDKLKDNKANRSKEPKSDAGQQSSNSNADNKDETSTEPLVLTTDEKLPSEDALDSRNHDDKSSTEQPIDASSQNDVSMDHPKINPLKNYRHQRLQSRAMESSLSQLERTASSLNPDGVPAFRKNLDTITSSYSPGDEKPTPKSRKKKTPNKIESAEARTDRPSNSGMSHSVSSMLSPETQKPSEPVQTTVPVPPMGQSPGSHPRLMSQSPHETSHEHLAPPIGKQQPHMPTPVNMAAALPSVVDPSKNVPPMPAGQAYPTANAPHDPYSQYPPGYPLQNNLLEYWCMVDFVRPNYLGSKTEFCNMFERPIQNGQCIDSTPQDIRLMRYRAHVLHSLLVGFVQRRSHAVLQSTLPQKEEFVLLIRMTPLQRKLYDRFMNEVVRSTSVPNPLKAFAICCKIWNHPDVLYNFLRKRSEANAAIEEDLDLEELGGVTKAGRATRSKAPPRRAAKPRGGKGASKKPAATIPPNQTSTGPPKHPGDTNSFGNYGPNGPPYGAPVPYGPNQEGSYPPYQNYPNSGQGYYPPNQGYNQNYGNNYYQQQPYGNNYPNQYPQNSQDPNYNQNYWGNGNGNNYYGNNGSGYYNNPQYPNNQPPQNYPGGQPPPDYRANQTPQNYTGTQPPDYNNPQPYPPNYTAPPTDPSYTGNMVQPYQNNQEGYANQPQPPYAQGSYPNQQGYPGYNATPGVSTPVPGPSPTYPTQPAPSYPNQTYPPTYPGNSSTYPNAPGPYNPQYGPNNYPGYPDNAAPNEVPINNIPGDQVAIKDEPAVNYPANGPIKTEGAMPPNNPDPNYDSTGYNYNQPIASGYPNQIDPSTNTNYAAPYDGYPSHLETKPPLGSSGSPITAWPIIKTEVDRLKAEVKNEVKSESDGEVKIEDLDTKKLVKEGSKKEVKPENPKETHLETADNKHKKDDKEKKAGEAKSGSESEEEVPKKGKQKAKGKETRPEGRRKPGPKPKGKPGPKPRGRKDRKTSKDKNDDSDSEDSDKEEKLNREEELALVKKAEEMTYDWAAELLKDYIPGIIENSAKMELFFYILNESIKLGDRILLFSQSLFTLNLIEDFLQRNYIPGTNCVWQKNTNYYRLDGSTHALEREKLINEFNANPHVYLFLVSTRAGSLGINLVGANRVIVFDASWNPCHDTQAVCRVYRYGQKKPCFVYRFVMDWCLEKKIYDRQINKQGMADRVVDECNPDAVLSMKEITNLCFDNDEKETEVKDLSEHKDKYIDVIMQGIITQLGQQLSKEPFQHESLLVDRKEKKLSSAEKRLAQRGYELEKKAAAAPKPTTAYRTVRTADGSIVQRPVASVRPMQHGARWIPADVWRRQGMTAQEMTLPLDVVIPTNSAEKTNIVLKAGQRVMVLKSPKGIYMQLESGKIIAIKTSLKGLAGKSGDNKDGVGKKIMGPRPSTANIPGSLKNNSAITITSKTGLRPGLQRIMNRPSMMGQNKIIRPLITGQRPRLPGTDMKAYNARRLAIPQGRSIRPNLPGSLSITKISKKPDNENSDSNNASKIDAESEEDTQVLDSDDEEGKEKAEKIRRDKLKDNKANRSKEPKSDAGQQSSNSNADNKDETSTEPLVLTTDEKLPSEDALDSRNHDDKSSTEQPIDASSQNDVSMDHPKINPLKNYRHQRLQSRAMESSLSQLERTASSLNPDGVPAFRKNLDTITSSYSPGDEKPTPKSRKKKTPNKIESAEARTDRPSNSGMSHSVSSMLSPETQKPSEPVQTTVPVPPMGQSPGSHPRLMSQSPHETSHEHLAPPIGKQQPHMPTPVNMAAALPSVVDPSKNVPPMPAGQAYPTANAPHDPYSQYPPGYGMGYPGYPNAPYYGGYGAPPYYPGYPATAAAYPPAPTPPSAPTPEGFLPPNPQW